MLLAPANDLYIHILIDFTMVRLFVTQNLNALMIIVSSTKISISKDISNTMGSNIIQQALLLISKTPTKEG